MSCVQYKNSHLSHIPWVPCPLVHNYVPTHVGFNWNLLLTDEITECPVLFLVFWIVSVLYIPQPPTLIILYPSFYSHMHTYICKLITLHASDEMDSSWQWFCCNAFVNQKSPVLTHHQSPARAKCCKCAESTFMKLCCFTAQWSPRLQCSGELSGDGGGWERQQIAGGSTYVRT